MTGPESVETLCGDFESAMTIRTEQAQGAAPVKVLLTDTNRWALSARLAIALSRTGCDVSAICSASGHPLSTIRTVRNVYRYSSLRPLESLAAAIRSCDPDIVIPSCDRGVEHLHELYLYARALGSSWNGIAALIERSLGPASSHGVVSSRYDLLAIARQEGILVPETARITTLEELRSWSAREPLPWILKADGTWGGGGVRVVRSNEGLDESFRQLTRRARLGKALKRLLVNRDPFWLRPWLLGSRRSVIAQSYVQGRPANCSAVSWNGRVLGVICVEVVRSDGLTGPASVVRIVDNPAMVAAAEKIAARLGLSGFFGLDFMLEEGTGLPYLIEMNPRATPPCHLSLSRGRDLPAVLWSQLASAPLREREPVTESELIAYFPQLAHSSHELPSDCFQDVPDGEPDLVEALLRPFPERTLLFRLVQGLMPNPRPAEAAEFLKNAAP